MDNILIVNHNLTDSCGVYKHGKRMAYILSKSTKYNFIEVRCNSIQEYLVKFNEYNPSVCIYNYYPGTLNWATEATQLPAHHIGLVHEVSYNSIPEGIFKKWIATDPSFPDSKFIKTVRPIFDYNNTHVLPEIPTIGSFGFAFPNKGFQKIVKAVTEEFDRALIRFHITIAAFNGGYDNPYLETLKKECESLLKPGIGLSISTNYIDDLELVDFLAQNTLNCLFYDMGHGRGISSAVDYCISAERPLCITKSEQFRHIDSLLGYYPEVSLKQSLTNLDIVKDIKSSWNPEIFISQYENIVSNLVGN